MEANESQKLKKKKEKGKKVGIPSISAFDMSTSQGLPQGLGGPRSIVFTYQVGMEYV